MNLKVVKYQNYGCTMSSECDDTIFSHKFYWSFYELSSGQLIVLNFIENLKNGSVSSNNYEFSYANSVLKNNSVIKYKFGQDFYEWFESLPSVNDLKSIKFPTNEEKECVKRFFVSKIKCK